MNANVLKSEQPSAATVKSATRVLEIFEYFDEVRRPVTIQDVAQALSYPHSSTAALLKSLVSLGYLEHDDRGKTFFPSIRISLLGNWVEAEALPIRNVQRLMRRLSADTGCTIILAARLGAYAQYVKVIQGTSPIRFHVKPSTKRMLAFSTIGRVLLSELPLPEARRLIHDALAAMPIYRIDGNPLLVTKKPGYLLLTSGDQRLRSEIRVTQRGQFFIPVSDRDRSVDDLDMRRQLIQQ